MALYLLKCKYSRWLLPHCRPLKLIYYENENKYLRSAVVNILPTPRIMAKQLEDGFAPLSISALPEQTGAVLPPEIGVKGSINPLNVSHSGVCGL